MLIVLINHADLPDRVKLSATYTATFTSTHTHTPRHSNYMLETRFCAREEFDKVVAYLLYHVRDRNRWYLQYFNAQIGDVVEEESRLFSW